MEADDRQRREQALRTLRSVAWAAGTVEADVDQRDVQPGLDTQLNLRDVVERVAVRGAKRLEFVLNELTEAIRRLT